MRKGIITGLALLCCFGMLQVAGQGKKKKPVAPPAAQQPTNVELIAQVDTDIDSFMMQDTSTSTRYFLFPEFYFYWPITKGDTTIKYQCYDARNSYINIDTLRDPSAIWHIQTVKVFTNYLHTYIDADGRPRPSAATKTVLRYDREDNDTWKIMDNSANFLSTLKEHRSDIARMDTTTVVNPVTGGKQLTIRRYYKVEELKHKGEIEQDQ